MQSGSSEHTTLIGWNGVRLTVPAMWETRVNAPCHLIFEDEFLPILQLRWDTIHSSPKDLQQIAAAFAERAETVILAEELAPEWRQLKNKFQILTCSGDKEGTPTGGLFRCPQCHALFQFQVFPDHMPVTTLTSDCLATLSCHGHREALWRVQDFSLITPQSFGFTGSSFMAGLTRLSFRAGNLTLDTCTLAPADVRLSRQSLAEILLILTATPDLKIRNTENRQTCEGFRSPGIAGRTLLRLRRCKPYVRAKIWHDRPHNRLLALVLTGSRPIPGDILPTLARSYAII